MFWTNIKSFCLGAFGMSLILHLTIVQPDWFLISWSILNGIGLIVSTIMIKRSKHGKPKIS